MEDRRRRRARAAGSANGRTSPRRSSSIVSAKSSDSWPAARSMSRTRRALSPIASPAVRRRHPLVDDHRGRGPRLGGRRVRMAARRVGAARVRISSPDRRPRSPAAPCTAPAGTAAAPRAARTDRTGPRSPRHLGRRRAAPRRAAWSTNAQQRAGEVLRAAGAPSAASCERDDRVLESGSSRTAAISRAISNGSLRRRRARRRRPSSPARPSPRRRAPARACRSLDERHAEALVLAGAEEQIRDVVERGQLLVRHVAEEVHVRRAEPRDRAPCSIARYRSNPPYEPTSSSRDARVVPACGRRGTRG